MKIATCKRCPAKIVWLKTQKGGAMPVDAETVKEGDLNYDHTRHVSHFATCPSAHSFRSRSADLIPRK